mmetsp:Transcript_765/g.1518  ORF Transcript_765/g.1518 Transcript_765/m.1518 type:complete len:290 (-) Transcript_765:71-940(-)
MGNADCAGNRNAEAPADAQPPVPPVPRPETQRRTDAQASSNQGALRQSQPSSGSRSMARRLSSGSRSMALPDKANALKARAEGDREHVRISKDAVTWIQGTHLASQEVQKRKNDEQVERQTIEKSVEDFTGARININLVEETKHVHVMTLMGDEQQREAAKKTLQSLANRCRVKETVQDAVLYAGLFSDTASWEQLPQKDWSTRNLVSGSHGDFFHVDIRNHLMGDDLEEAEVLDLQNYGDRSDKSKEQDDLRVSDFRQRMIKNQSWYSQIGNHHASDDGKRRHPNNDS